MLICLPPYSLEEEGKGDHVRAAATAALSTLTCPLFSRLCSWRTNAPFGSAMRRLSCTRRNASAKPSALSPSAVTLSFASAVTA
eukprot:2224990-Rhodomonas_salina.1